MPTKSEIQPAADILDQVEWADRTALRSRSEEDRRCQTGAAMLEAAEHIGGVTGSDQA